MIEEEEAVMPKGMTRGYGGVITGIKGKKDEKKTKKPKPMDDIEETAFIEEEGESLPAKKIEKKKKGNISVFIIYIYIYVS